MELLHNFGFEPVLYFAQIVNFLVIFLLFKKFLYKPILKILKEREDKIKLGIDAYEKAAKIISDAKQEKEDLIKKTSLETQDMIDQSKKAAEKIKQDLIDQSKLQADKIIANARIQIRLEAEESEKKLKLAALTISEKLLKNILSNLFSKEEQSYILQKAIEKLSKEKN